jgi:glycosyltransferase involved in cell wall biosynthesis
MTRRPRILSVFSTFATGGPQIRFAAIANHFGSAWRHEVVAMDGNYAAIERLDSRLDISYPNPGLIKGDTRGNIFRIRDFLRERRPDVLATNNWGSIEWAMANCLAPLARQVHIEDGFGPEERERQIPRRVWTRRLALRRAEIVLPSQTLFALARDVWRLPKRRLHYLPNGIDLSRFAPLPRVPGDMVVIGTAAALRAEKNLARLLRAFHILRQTVPARLEIAGDGVERPHLEALAAELGIAADVRFLGHLADPAPFYRGLDIYALSSDTEQMPLSVLEAMAAGLPVAATDVGDLRAMLAQGRANEESAFCLAALSPEALAQALRTLAASADLRAGIGAANRARVAADYSQEAMFVAYAALFAPPG